MTIISKYIRGVTNTEMSNNPETRLLEEIELINSEIKMLATQRAEIEHDLQRLPTRREKNLHRQSILIDKIYKKTSITESFITNFVVYEIERKGKHDGECLIDIEIDNSVEITIKVKVKSRGEYWEIDVLNTKYITNQSCPCWDDEENFLTENEINCDQCKLVDFIESDEMKDYIAYYAGLWRFY